MAFIKVIKNDTEFHLEIWNEPALIELGIIYEIVSPTTGIELISLEQLQSQ